MKLKILLLIFTVLFFLSFTSATGTTVRLADHGTDVRNSTNDLVNGNLSIFIYDEYSGGNEIFNQTFTDGIVNGSWNVIIVADMEYGTTYYKDYEINGEDVDFSGDERINFTATSGYINNATFFNFSLIQSCNSNQAIYRINENGSVECVNVSSSSNLTNYALKNQSETFSGNITTTHYGFFGYLGSLVSRITKLFVADIDISGDVNVTGTITLNGTSIDDWDDVNISSGSSVNDTTWNLTGSTYLYNDSGILDINETVLNSSIDTRVNSTNLTNYMLKNESQEMEGDLIPSADNTYSLGNSTNQWSDLYVSNGTIYVGGVALNNNQGVLQWDGENIIYGSYYNTTETEDIILINSTDGIYLYNSGKAVYLNESKLNSTILSTGAVFNKTNLINELNATKLENGTDVWFDSVGIGTDTLGTGLVFDITGDARINGNLTILGELLYGTSNNTTFNASIYPGQDAIYDVGNSTNRWRNATFSGTVNTGNILVDEKNVLLEDGTNWNYTLLNETIDERNLWNNTNGNLTFVGGRVGIGTDSPSAKLHIASEAIGGTPYSGSNVVIEGDKTILQFMSPINDSSVARSYIMFGNPENNYAGAIAYYHNDSSINGSQHMSLRVNGYYGLDVGEDNFKVYSGDATNVRFFVNRTSGNVGIGTVDPTARLDVETSSGGVASFGDSTTSATGNWGFAVGRYSNASGSYSTAIGYNASASNNVATALGFGAKASGMYSTAIGRGIEAGANYTVAIGLDNMAGTNCSQVNSMCIMGGNVGIGTTTPTQKLSVSGNVSISECIIFASGGKICSA